MLADNINRFPNEIKAVSLNIPVKSERGGSPLDLKKVARSMQIFIQKGSRVH
jgi:hypothetical protein